MVKSPDGTYLAHTGVRGFVDSVRSRLYVRKIGGSKTRSVDLLGCRGSLKWSTDSRRVAVADLDYDGCDLCVFDVYTGKLLHISAPTGIKLKSPQTQESVPKLGWSWHDPDEILVSIDRTEESASLKAEENKPQVVMRFLVTPDSVMVVNQAGRTDTTR